jgi:Ser/Thr protein kinase RdoA (MazF antagonist)
MHSSSELDSLIRTNYLNTANIVIKPVPKGAENQNYYVWLDGREYVLRVYSIKHATTGLRNKQEIEFEINFIEHLRKHKVLTPAVIHILDGSRIASAFINNEIRFAALFEYVAGEEPAAYNGDIARSIAITLLNIRKASATFKHGEVRKWPGNIIEVSLNYYAENRRLIDIYKDVLDGLYDNTMAGYEKIKKEMLPTGIIHGDIKLENVLVDSNQVKAVLDFDDYRESYLIEELTRTLLHDLESTTRNAIRSGYFSAFREIFENDASVSTPEMASLKTFLMARFIYDVTVYLSQGYKGLVGELFADKNIAEVIGFAPEQAL